MNKESENDCFTGLNKIFVLLFIPILVGYIIFEVQKIDTIRIKKMESFEIVIDSFNEISKKASLTKRMKGAVQIILPLVFSNSAMHCSIKNSICIAIERLFCSEMYFILLKFL